MRNLKHRKNRIQTAFLNALQSPEASGNVKIACIQSGVSRRTIYRYREQDLLFKKNWDIAVRTTKYYLTEEAEYALRKLVLKGNVRAIILTLKNFRSDKWRN